MSLCLCVRYKKNNNILGQIRAIMFVPAKSDSASSYNREEKQQFFKIIKGNINFALFTNSWRHPDLTDLDETDGHVR